MLKKKKGNSSSDERMRFIEEMLKIFPAADIRCLCGDREFIGQAWVRYLLLEPMLAFCLRIRATDKTERKVKTLAAKVVFILPLVNLNVFKGIFGFGVTLFLLKPSAYLTILYSSSLDTLIPLVSFKIMPCVGALKLFLAFLRLVAFAWNLLTFLTPNVFVSFLLY